MSISFIKIIVSLFVCFSILNSDSFIEERKCKDPSQTNPTRRDFSSRVDFLCKEYAKPVAKKCDNVAGTYSISAVFNSDHCGISNTPMKTFTIYVTQQECTITVSYENAINPDTGWVDGDTATFSGTSLIGEITDIHSISVTKTGSSIVGNGTSTLSGASFEGCVIAKNITGTLVSK